MVVGGMDSCVLWAVIDVLRLRGIAQLAHHVRDTVRGDGNASQLAITARSHMAVRAALVDSLRCRDTMGSHARCTLVLRWSSLMYCRS